MPNFRNLKDLERYMKKILKDSMEDAGREIEHTLRDQIDEDVYNSYDPKEYERTRELKNSVMHTQPKEINGQIFVEIGHDYNQIYSNPEKYQHASVWGDDVSEYLPKWINDGTIGLAFGKGAWTEPRPYMDNTKEKIKDKGLFERELKVALEKRGIKTD